MYYNNNMGQLGGTYIVEMDESCMKSKRKYGRGRYNGTQWVFGMIERGTGKCKFVVVPDRKRSTLLAIIRNNVIPGTFCVKGANTPLE